MENEKIVYGVYFCSKTNSAFFTKCCSVAICDDEQNCPRCKSKIIGWDAESGHKRRMIRWNYAYGRR